MQKPSDILDFSGRFVIKHIRDGVVIDQWDAPNAVTLEGRRHMLGATLSGSAPITTWYIGIYRGNISPDESWQAVSVSANSDEIDITYDEATREEWIEGLHATAASISNAATDGGTPAEFNFNAPEASVRGAFLISASAKLGTNDATATLMAIANFTPRTIAASDILIITYEISTSTV